MLTFTDILKAVLLSEEQEKIKKFIIIKTLHDDVYYFFRGVTTILNGRIVVRKGIWKTKRSEAMKFVNRDDAETFARNSKLSDYEVMLKVSE